MIPERFKTNRPPGRRQGFPLHHGEDIVSQGIEPPPSGIGKESFRGHHASGEIIFEDIMGFFYRSTAFPLPLQQIRHRGGKETIEEVVKRMSKEGGVREQELKTGEQRRKITEVRARIAYWLSREMGISMAEIARNLGVGTSAIAMAVKYPAAELRGIQFSKNSPPPRWGRTKVGVTIRPFPLTLTLSPRGEGRPFIPPAELRGILAYFYKERGTQ